jgi:hypothetical protein
MRIVDIVAAVMMSIVLGGCAGPAVSPSAAAPIATPVASKTCPPQGSFVPFSKVMNNAFVRDYEGCSSRDLSTVWAYAAMLKEPIASESNRAFFMML